MFYTVHYYGEVLKAQDLNDAKRKAKNLGPQAKVVKSKTPYVAPKAHFFYGGEEVEIVEERQNNYYLVNALSGAFYFRFAPKAEVTVEFR